VNLFFISIKRLLIFLVSSLVIFGKAQACSPINIPDWSEWQQISPSSIRYLELQGIEFYPRDDKYSVARVVFPDLKITILFEGILEKHFWTPEMYIALELHKATGLPIHYSRANEIAAVLYDPLYNTNALQHISVGRYNFLTTWNLPASRILFELAPYLIQKHFPFLTLEWYGSDTGCGWWGVDHFVHQIPQIKDDIFLVLSTRDGTTIRQDYVFGGEFPSMEKRFVYHASIESMIQNAQMLSAPSAVIVRFTGVVSQNTSGFYISRPVLSTTGEFQDW
jgi:hypothetical protein